MSNLGEVLQETSADTIVELFIFDATTLGGGVFRFTTTAMSVDPNTGIPAPLPYDGVSYQYLPMESDGWEVTAQGTMPTPTVTVSRVNDIFQNLVVQYGDLLGCILYRIRTFATFLDNGATPDHTAYMMDTYRLERKATHTATQITWELSAILDQHGVQLPKRQALRNSCTHTYRAYDGNGGFNYTNASCPYTGTQYFDQAGNVTTVDKDKCGKRLSDCKLRFGATNQLPTRAFPGMIRLA